MNIVWSFIFSLPLINLRGALFSAVSATDLDESLEHSHLPEDHVLNETTIISEFHTGEHNDNLFGVGKEEEPQSDSAESMVEVEVFKELPEDHPKLAEFLLGTAGHSDGLAESPAKEHVFHHGSHIHFNPSRSIDVLLDERAHHLASVSKEQTRLEKQLMEESADCLAVRRVAADLQSNVSGLEMKLEVMKMARHQAVEQYQIMLYDFVECQKRMSISNYLKNESLKMTRKLNDSVTYLKRVFAQCVRNGIDLSMNVENLVGRLEKSQTQLSSTLKMLNYMNQNMTKSNKENEFLKSKLSDKVSEVNRVEDELNILRNKLANLQILPSGDVGDEEANSAKLKNDGDTGAVNTELKRQIDLMIARSEEQKKEYEEIGQFLRDELRECEQQRGANTNKTTKQADHNHLCSDARIDAAYNLDSRTVIIFKGGYFWVLEKGEQGDISISAAQLINSTFERGPPRVDAAFKDDITDQIYLFHGVHYWQYIGSDETLVEDSPKLIADGRFSGVPNNVDAAFVWKENGRLYFIKGDFIWRSEDDKFRRYEIKDEFALMRLTNKIIDAVFELDDSTIFVTDDLYFRYDDSNHMISNSDPPYPRLICTWIFGCPAASQCAKTRLL
ncbi:Hypothetical predicted protein [Cloeon dipterum]|uniref:Olfactomedin-like domain-containing protein n=1 Tax=Cloeon dipterum TaxID=197152 RepID=A0A8S1C2W8_9INSE|nr:Hypothetical predicted protein [Cloeon dipterum]